MSEQRMACRRMSCSSTLSVRNKSSVMRRFFSGSMRIEALLLLCCLSRWLVHGFNNNLLVEQNLLQDTKASVYHLCYGNLQQKHYLRCCFGAPLRILLNDCSVTSFCITECDNHIYNMTIYFKLV